MQAHLGCLYQVRLSLWGHCVSLQAGEGNTLTYTYAAGEVFFLNQFLGLLFVPRPQHQEGPRLQAGSARWQGPQPGCKAVQQMPSTGEGLGCWEVWQGVGSPLPLHTTVTCPCRSSGRWEDKEFEEGQEEKEEEGSANVPMPGSQKLEGESSTSSSHVGCYLSHLSRCSLLTFLVLLPYVCP